MFVQKICLLKFVKFTPIWKLPVSRETMLNALQINSFQTIFSIKNIWKLCHWLIGYLLRDACCVWTVLMRGWWCREVVHSEAPHSRFIRLNVATTRIAKKRARIQRALTQYVRRFHDSVLPLCSFRSC